MDPQRPFSYVKAVAFSPDSKLLASVSGDWTVKLWNASSGVVRQTLEGCTSPVYAVAFSPDATLLTSALWDSTIKLSGTQLGTVQMLEAIRATFKLWPSCRIVRCWRRHRRMERLEIGISSQGKMQQMFHHYSSAGAVAFMPGGKLLALGSKDGTVKLLDIESGAVQQTLGSHSSSVSSVAFSPDGKQLASSSYGVKLWN